MSPSNTMMNQRRRWRKLLCVSLLVCIAGCTSKDLETKPVEAVLTKATSTATTEASAAIARKERVFESTPRGTDSLVVALDADMSSGSARSGEAIRRGLELAINQINREGGLLGRPVELIVRDHRGNPDRGLGNLKAFKQVENLIGVFGGIHTPVAIRELEFIHENRMLYLCPWAAGTPIVANGYSPNHVFRVSVRDEYAGGFLVRKAIEHGGQKIALMLEQTAWGRSNEAAMNAAFEQLSLSPVAIEWFNWGDRDLLPRVNRLASVGCDTILFVGNSLEGVALTKAIASLPVESRPAIVSHWGITGGEFYEMAADYLDKVDLSFLQTYSFVCPTHPERVEELLADYVATYHDCEGVEGIFAPVGTAHAYELMQMLATAVKNAGSIDHLKVLSSLEALRDYRGIIRDYEHPFPPTHHDALDAKDFILARFDDNGVIKPVCDE